MAYSDSGGYAWLNSKPYKLAEDATLAGTLAPEKQPLLAHTGMKLDVFLNAYAAAGVNPSNEEETARLDWDTQQPHHIVLGSLEGLALLGYKYFVTVTWNGKRVVQHPTTSDYKEEEIGFHVTQWKHRSIDRQGNVWLCAVSLFLYAGTHGCKMYLKTPGNDVYLGVIGYGLGKHYWKNDDGYALRRAGERKHEFVTDSGEMDFIYWISEEDEAEDCKKFNVEPGAFVGIKEDEKYPTYKELEIELAAWEKDLDFTDAPVLELPL